MNQMRLTPVSGTTFSRYTNQISNQEHNSYENHVAQLSKLESEILKLNGEKTILPELQTNCKYFNTLTIPKISLHNNKATKTIEELITEILKMNIKERINYKDIIDLTHILIQLCNYDMNRENCNYILVGLTMLYLYQEKYFTAKQGNTTMFITLINAVPKDAWKNKNVPLELEKKIYMTLKNIDYYMKGNIGKFACVIEVVYKDLYTIIDYDNNRIQINRSIFENKNFQFLQELFAKNQSSVDKSIYVELYTKCLFLPGKVDEDNYEKGDILLNYLSLNGIDSILKLILNAKYRYNDGDFFSRIVEYLFKINVNSKEFLRNQPLFCHTNDIIQQLWFCLSPEQHDSYVNMILLKISNMDDFNRAWQNIPKILTNENFEKYKLKFEDKKKLLLSLSELPAKK